MDVTFVESADDPRLDDFRNLNKSDSRDGQRLIIGEGPLVVGRVLESRFPARAIIGFGGRLSSFLDANPDLDLPIYEVTRETLAEVAGFDLHRGLLISADRAPALPVEDVLADASSVLVLEGVGDHENIGAMFRNAAGLGVDAILFGAGCADPLYRRVVRVSMGHVLRTPFAHFDGTPTTWQRNLSLLKERGFHIVSLTPNPDAVTIAEALDGKEKVALLLGAEGPGLTEHAMRATDVRARIPMAPGTDSLNVATAAAIAMYEHVRR